MLKGFLSDVESMKAKIIKVDGQRLIVEIQEPFKEELIKKQAESVEIHIDDTDAEKINLASVSFTNTETEYAYLSSQAYAENTIKRSST